MSTTRKSAKGAMADPKPPSAAELRALQILDTGPVSAYVFAERMWPDAPGWKRKNRRGVYGSGMWRAGGAFLGKLRKKGWILDVWNETRSRKTEFAGYELSFLGKRVLRAVHE